MVLAPGPESLTAATRNSYETPLVRPGIVAATAVAAMCVQVVHVSAEEILYSIV
ncbi:unannotated protein [freshwater metagenome]|uniref:Unannotated protein n=1 Tax=freshwater metagenome TaxID=449393 RepID=A0A6J6UBS4_9ZZZZ